MLSHGRKVFEGTKDEARAALPLHPTLTAQAAPSSLPGVAAAKRLDGEGGAKHGEWSEWEVKLNPDTTAPMLLQYCTENGFVLRRFDVHRASLHDVFLHHVGAKETAK